MQRRTELRAVGKRKQEWARWEEHSQMVTRARARGRCEGCFRQGRSLEHHHVFGRPFTGARLGEPFASHPLLCARLCRNYRGERGCHEQITDGANYELKERLQEDAFEEFAAKFGKDFERERGSTATEAMRRLVDRLLAQGWHYDHGSNRLREPEAA